MFNFPDRYNQSILITWVVCVLLLAVAAASAMLYEKKHLLEKEFARIYHTTYAVKGHLDELPADRDPAALKCMLDVIMKADKTVLFYSLTDAGGRIVLSDNDSRLGKEGVETATIKEITRPLYKVDLREKDNRAPSRFVIYCSSMNESMGEKELIYDAMWDMSGRGTRFGTFRVGFSRKGIHMHLFILAFLITCPGFVLLTGVMVLFRRVLKSSHESTKRLQTSFSGMEQMKKDLDDVEMERNRLEIKLREERKKTQKANRMILHREEERKTIEARMLNVQKLEAVGTLAGGIAHEFNNLFMAITGYASLIQKKSPPDHPNADKAKKILELVNTGSQSIKQLLGFARSGKYVQETLNMNEVIRMTLEMFRKTRKDLTVETDFANGLWKIYADHSQMEHVVMNLFLNASEAMPSNGVIRIETRNIVLEKKQISTDRIVSGRFIQFGIKDEGSGIKPEHLSRIFDPFFTTKHLSTGSGLGLASVHGIINNHNGFTAVESTAGQGTLFNVFLPAAKKETG